MSKYRNVMNLVTYQVETVRLEEAVSEELASLVALLQVAPSGKLHETPLDIRRGDWVVSKLGKGEEVR